MRGLEQAAGKTKPLGPANVPAPVAPLPGQSRVAPVQSVYNIPPLGALGVAPSGGSLTFLDAPDGADELGVFSYTVPAGKTFLLRGVEYSFYPIYPDSSLASAVSPLILVDGGSVDVFQDAGKLQSTGMVPYFRAFGQRSVIRVQVRRVSTITWAVRFAGLPPAQQAALAPSFNARLVGELVTADGLPVDKAQGTRY